MNATIKDVARESGFSIATVSRVLNNANASYSSKTAKKIKKVAQSLGYHKNNIAANLVKRTSTTIAVIINSVKTNFSFEILSGIQEEANKNHYSVIILYAGNRSDNLTKQAIETAIDRSVSGILLVAMQLNQENTEMLRDANIPYLFVSTHPNNPLEKFVSSDNHLITQTAVNYLIKMGHKKIGLVGIDQHTTGKERLAGYKKQMLANNLSINNEFVQYGDYSYESGQKIIEKIGPLIKNGDLTAVIAASDMIGAGLIKGAKKEKIKVPDDLSIVSIDGTYICEITSSELSSITQDFRQIGSLSVETLLKKKNSKFVPIKLIKRKSVKNLM
ncbi:LacI family DNA-binding transcriptional regulator [Lactobacillus sp. LL6]|uniref:LacI family DNA-binding transcriptional regulator n=1 Tax=Lactobacillus sp. LL6 TaxID=2596827 RepID=UPI0011852764|nr:LacI family DNA-binding transcriptional regulator [Lactobacillus sp. LL6]TSO25413.1 LacI family transcriptional regulator [Lactobacillus sp. LL6]